MADLDEHRDAVDRALASAGVGWDAWPEAAATAPLDDGARLSALLLMLGAPAPREVVPGGYRMLADPVPEIVDRLRRRRLPWDPGTATTALRVVRELGEPDDRRVAVALRGAEQVCAAGRADAGLLDELVRLRDWLDAHPTHVWRVPELRVQVRRVVAAATPPEVLDLSLLVDGDAWVDPARDVARRLPVADVGPLIRLLGDLGPRKPPQVWRRAVGQALDRPAARELVRRWLLLAAETDVVAPDEATAIGFSGGMLFAFGNDDLVRATVLATEHLAGEAWVPETLGILARRGAATSGKPGMTASLAHKVAGAAVDTLATRGTPEDRAVLTQLLEDLSRRDLVKRVGAALGRDDVAAARDAQLRRDKAAAVRRKADPAPARVRSEADAVIRRQLGPQLRRLGFTGTPRTWRRVHEDRVDLVAVRSGSGRLTLVYGTRFDAAHPDDEPWPVDRAKARDHHLDVRLAEQFVDNDEGFGRCGRHLEAAVLPFLDGLGRYELARAYLEHGAGAPPGAEHVHPVGSPAAVGTVGLLALAAGERDVAVAALQARVAREQEWTDDSYRSDGAEVSLAFWRRQLDRARRVP